MPSGSIVEEQSNTSTVHRRHLAHHFPVILPRKDDKVVFRSEAVNGHPLRRHPNLGLRHLQDEFRRDVTLHTANIDHHGVLRILNRYVPY